MFVRIDTLASIWFDNPSRLTTFAGLLSAGVAFASGAAPPWGVTTLQAVGALVINAGVAHLLANMLGQYGQALDYPAIQVDVNRQMAGQLGVTVDQVGRSFAAATSSSRFVASPTFSPTTKGTFTSCGPLLTSISIGAPPCGRVVPAGGTVPMTWPGGTVSWKTSLHVPTRCDSASWALAASHENPCTSGTWTGGGPVRVVCGVARRLQPCLSSGSGHS